MATLLLTVIYLIFISLGLPDSLLGAAWPAAHLALGVPVSYAGFISPCITVGTVISSLFSVRAIRRFGTGPVVACSVFLTASALLGFSFANRFVFLCLLALPLGLGGGAIDSALNNYIATHYQPMHMNFLHAFWGVGATAGPIIISAFLSRGNDWQGGYRAVACIQAGLFALAVVSLPLWKRAGLREAAADDAPIVTDNRVAIKAPGALAGMLAFLFYCAVEMTAGLWAATYFVEVRNVEASVAARWGSLFFFGIMAGRTLAGLLSLRLRPETLIRIGLATAAAGAASLLVPLPQTLQLAGLLLVGAGCAPIFPNMLQLTPARFGAAHAQALTGLQLAASYIGCTLMPPLYGYLGQTTGFQSMPVFFLACLALTLLFNEWLNARLRRDGLPGAASKDKTV